MLYFKILMLAVATLAALSVFADGDKSQRGRYALLFIGSAALYLAGYILDLATKGLI